ncbi:hypothetical protein [Candidatus Cyanaurora vandensis]|uniref:hypothetical protein n=1 Tax=Candidatus Cyanaurora vandensis TaxID=2714958 RepID=UPI00257AEF1B|nr:hypothetical protein [Candidatus Cyanaurora vandensis]
MKVNLHTAEIIKAISLDGFAQHLAQSGWEKRRLIGNKASVWTKNHGDDESEVVLPLNPESSDYLIRMWDTLNVLENVDGLSSEEIIMKLASAKFFARSGMREVISLRLFVDELNKTELDLHILSSSLRYLQATLYSIGQVKIGLNSKGGRIPQMVMDSTRLSVISTFPGSSGIRLGTTQQIMQGELFGPPLSTQTFKEFAELVNESLSVEGLREKATSLKTRSASNYKKFLSSVSLADTAIEVDWGSPFDESGLKVMLPAMTIKSAIQVLDEIVEEMPEQVTTSGILIGGNKRNKRFEFNSFDGEDYTGTISEEIIKNGRVMTLSSSYTAIIEVIWENTTSTGESNARYKLLDLIPFEFS